jgi:hypothetical protein
MSQSGRLCPDRHSVLELKSPIFLLERHYFKICWEKTKTQQIIPNHQTIPSMQGSTGRWHTARDV